MMTERLSSADRRIVLTAVLVMAASVWYTARNYAAAFPEASLDLKLSKVEITARAARFLSEQGLSTQGFRNLTVFDPDEEARVFLEREAGLAEANRLMRGEVAVWRWRARWFRPPDEEERVVYLAPSGTIVGLNHIIPEAAPGARLTREAARQRAEAFLRERTREPHRLIEEQLQERPARYDHVFTWEREGFQVKGATYRRTVLIQGDRVGRYSESLYVPEKWQREFAALRSSNDLYYQTAEVLLILLALAAVGVLIGSVRRRVVHWRPLALIAATVGVLMVANEWNSLPFFVDGMPTSSPYGQSVLFGLMMGLGAGVGVFLYVILGAAAGEPLNRAAHPGHLSLLRLPSLAALRTKEFFLATVTGYGFAAFHIAFLTAFYLIGSRFGVWSPQEVSYSDLLSTGLPWIYPLTISLLASASEEFWFRLLAIPLLRRYLKSRWLAVILPAFLWGFLHANYPQQPGYIRGLEVGIIGVAAGFLMLRFGVVATLVWHYTVDAVLIGVFLFRAESWYFQLSGWLVAGAVALPLALSLIFYGRHKGFVRDSSLLNASLGAALGPPEVEAEAAMPLARPVARRWNIRWLYVAAIGAAVAGFAMPPPLRYGDFIQVRISRATADDAALSALGTRVPDLRAWRRVAVFRSNLELTTFEYLRRVSGSHAANQSVRDRTQTGLWLVRFFQPLRKEEWHVWVDQRGRPARVDHLLDENTPGAQLSPGEAQRIASSLLEKEEGARAATYRLVDSSADKKDTRTDHHFVWEDPDFKSGDARARVTVDVVGGEVSGFRRYLKIPEEWLRDFSKPRVADVLAPASLGAVGFGLLILFLKRLTARGETSVPLFHWRVYAWVATGGAAVSILSAASRWPLATVGYDTAKPLDSFLWQFLAGRSTGVLTAAAMLFFAVLAADVFLEWTVGRVSLQRPSPVRTAAVLALLWGSARVASAVVQRAPGPRLSLPLWELPGGDACWPAVPVVGQAFLSACLTVCALTVFISAAVRSRRILLRWGLAGLAVVLYAAAQAQGTGQLPHYVAVAVLGLAVLMLLLRTCGTDLLTLALGLFWFLLVQPASTLLTQAETALRWNGVAVLAVGVSAGFAGLVARGGSESPQRTQI